MEKENILFISKSNAIESYCAALKDYLNLFGSKNQELYHAESLVDAIQYLKDLSHIDKIIMGDDWINDCTEEKAKHFNEFIYAKEKLSLFIPKSSHRVQWCFSIDTSYYDGCIKKLQEYCKTNEIDLYDNWIEFEQFICFTTSAN